MYKPLLLLLFLAIAGCRTSTDKKEVPEPTSSSTAFTIEDTVKNPSDITGAINIMGYFVEPLFAGVLKEDGRFKIELPTDFDQITKKAFEAYNTSPIAAYELNYTNALESFPNADILSFTGKEAKLAFAGKYYRFEVIGTNENDYIYPASSQNFVNYVIGTKDAVAETGHHYYYIYAKDPFSIKGESETKHLFEDGTDEIYLKTDSYNLKIKEGWNLIRYEINKLSESSLGTRSISKSSVFNENINTMPDTWFMGNY
ncbi:hypothetical protein F0365_11280 [Nonlabens sp. Ci31]|jgi:hypothetical protein|uniref:hypothetical protein n=1 Tax=Nonlabens sp. Ci31 TaxID=2608253 RepID=UPI00146386EE|nr:hypothetical protein [Nonlabens sp. Ci31]QJP34930.1 hypothetical protein F0365_11280 [Nonlabens sp. Ci31]